MKKKKANAFNNLFLSINEATLLFKPVFVYVFLEKSAIKHLFASLLIAKMETEPSTLISELVNLYLKFLKVKKGKLEKKSS